MFFSKKIKKINNNKSIFFIFKKKKTSILQYFSKINSHSSHTANQNFLSLRYSQFFE